MISADMLNSKSRAGHPWAKAVGQLIREAIEVHLEGMVEDGLPIPEPTSRVEYVEVNG